MLIGGGRSSSSNSRRLLLRRINSGRGSREGSKTPTAHASHRTHAITPSTVRLCWPGSRRHWRSFEGHTSSGSSHFPFAAVAVGAAGLCAAAGDDGHSPGGSCARCSSAEAAKASERQAILQQQQGPTPVLARAKAGTEAVTRLARTVKVVFQIVTDYKLHKRKEELGWGKAGLTPSEIKYEECANALHTAQERQGEAQGRLDKLEIALMDAQSRLKLLRLLAKRGRRAGGETNRLGGQVVVEEEEEEVLLRMKRIQGEIVEIKKEVAEFLRDVRAASAGMARADELGLTSSLSKVHKKSAERLRDLCAANGGIYIKLGQHVAQLDYVLPPEYVSTLTCMQDQAPTTPFEDVREVVKEDLGRYPEEIWASFSHEPIASASLAQVHVATTAEGKKVAVKVQHRGLKETSQGDIDAVTFLAHVVSNMFPDFTFTWLADEMKLNLPLELDFLNEGRNSERCGEMFKDHEYISVPSIHWEQSAHRVLAMDFEEGDRVTDLDRLEEQGIRLPRLAALISSVFCEQIFRHGYLHCDPHSSNVLVRPHEKPQGRLGLGIIQRLLGRKGAAGAVQPHLVILDHGLYRELNDDFRTNYCKLWKSLIFSDIPGIRKYCMVMGAGDLYPLLASMLTNRPWDDIVDEERNPLSHGPVETEKNMTQGYVQMYAFEISKILSQVPREMLMLFKTNDILRHIDRALGAPINTFVIAGRIVLDVLWKNGMLHDDDEDEDEEEEEEEEEGGLEEEGEERSQQSKKSKKKKRRGGLWARLKRMVRALRDRVTILVYIWGMELREKSLEWQSEPAASLWTGAAVVEKLAVEVGVPESSAPKNLGRY